MQACIENFTNTGRMTFIADHPSPASHRAGGMYGYDSNHNYNYDSSYNHGSGNSHGYHPRDAALTPPYRQPRMASANPAYHQHHPHHQHQQNQQGEGGAGAGGWAGGTWRSFQQRRNLEVNTERTPSSREEGEGDAAPPPQTWSAGGWVYGGVAPPPEEVAARLPSRQGGGGGVGPPTWGSELSEISVS